ncbi:MAG TPA: DUF488 domain-containing protein [Thermoanaerobaculia bacterium]|nr:DUF488 domain-containing protein [Thermoanaerobaculia bacterium]
MTIWTIGHSTRSLDELVALLRENGVERLADIRRYPGSRRHPHFSRESLERELPLEYIHLVDLGGRRKPLPDSRNKALKNDQFRAYADYLPTPEARRAIETLVSSGKRTAVMCAEAVPWRCHRNLLADELVRRGIEVIHILGPGQTKNHELSKIARVEGDRIVYGEPEQLSL